MQRIETCVYLDFDHTKKFEFLADIGYEINCLISDHFDAFTHLKPKQLSWQLVPTRSIHGPKVMLLLNYERDQNEAEIKAEEKRLKKNAYSREWSRKKRAKDRAEREEAILREAEKIKRKK